jgi:tRNA G18 (ribose-2'-O)-methylase SpoU
MSESNESDEIPSQSRLNAIKWNVHTSFQHFPPERLTEIAHDLAVPIQVMLVNLDGNMNIGMTVRTAAVLGCSDVWIVGQRRYDARPEVGGKHYVRVHKVGELADPAAFFEERGIQPILVEQGGEPLEDMSFKHLLRKQKPVCLIMGSEAHGIPKEWMKSLCMAPKVSISQYGLLRSLNVSIAASIVLYELFKQWRELRKDI